MIRDDIVKYFLINSDNRNIPYVSSKHWKVFKEKYLVYYEKGFFPS